MASKKSKDIEEEESSNEQLTKNVQQRRDSFEERVCDDLCEAILQWLPFDEKIKLIDVSKQFNRCLKLVWNSQKVLKIGSHVPKNDPNDCLEFLTQSSKNFMHNSTEVLRLTKLLQTFPNIISFELERKCEHYINISQVLDSIIKYCNKLESFKSDNIGNFELKSLVNFAQNLGPNIKTLVLYVTGHHSSNLMTLIKGCTTLTSLKLNGYYCVRLLSEIFDNDNEVTPCFVNNLTKLDAFMSFHDFIRIIEINNSFTRLNIKLILMPTTSQELIDIFAKISKLTQLEWFGLKLYMVGPIDLSYQQIANSFGLIAKNCVNLKTFYFDPFEFKFLEPSYFFTAFKLFSSLNKIKFCDHKWKGYNLDINCLKNCKQLTHLTINSMNISREFFTSIDSVLPHLKYLFMDIEAQAYSRDNEFTLTDNELKSMSRLKHLETLSINTYRLSKELSSITDFGMLSLINGCNHLNSVSFYSAISITAHSINSMVQKASDNPGVYYKYTFYLDIPNSMVSYYKSKCLCPNLNNIEIKIINNCE